MAERPGDGEDGSDPSAPVRERTHVAAPLRRDLVAAGVVAAGVLVALAVLAIARAASAALTALGVGVLFALALDPVLRATQRRFRCSRSTGTLVVGSALAVVLFGVVAVLGPQAAEQAQEFSDEIPETVESFYDWPVVGDRLRDADAAGSAAAYVDDLPNRVDADAIGAAADRLLSGLGTALLVLVTAVAVMLDGEALVARVRRTLPEERRERADEVGRIVYRSLARYFAGSVSVAILNGFVILTVGLLLGIPLAPLAGIWAAITNLIPQIGGLLGGSFFVLLAVTEGAVPGAIALVVFLGYQQFENNVIQPTVIGRAVDLTPPTTMLAALVGGAAIGVPGALVATPLVGAIKSVWLDARGEAPDEEDRPGSLAATALSRVRRLLGGR
ncbi:AI-2E family transporter [Ilumatobacter sp.]|uniref:AI-2E family transporter n=1 Tax=Ilumatobacter sp. TaxID=1967498 RepID=UPI003B525D63